MSTVKNYKEKPDNFTAQDALKVQTEIREAIEHIADLSPAMNADQKARVYRILGPLQDEDGLDGTHILDINTVMQQYLLVQKIRTKVMDANSVIAHDAGARELTALVNAINSVINLYLRNQQKVEMLQQVQQVKQAVNFALATAPKEVRERFLKAMQEAPIEGVGNG